MPGICGLIERPPHGESFVASARAMLNGLVHDSWHICAQHVDPRAAIALGSVKLDFVSQPRFARDFATGSILVLDGELYEAEKTTRSTGIAVYASEDSQAAILLAGYLQQGQAFLRQLHGSFTAVVWDPVEERLTILNDRFGSRPLYLKRTSAGLRLASNMTALLAGDPSSRRVSPRGLAQFFSFGHYLRDDTMLEGVTVLPAAACFSYDVASGELSKDHYWSLREHAVEESLEPDEWLERIDQAMAAAVHRQSAGTAHLGLSLSGGLDARTILGLIDTQQTPLQALCMGVRGSLDHRSSAELAEIAGCSYHAHILDDHFLRNFREHLDRTVELTDGQYLSQCIVIPTLGTYRKLGIHALLRGHAGELMHMCKAYNYSLDNAALEIRTDQQLHDWLFGRLQTYLLSGVTQPLFAPAYQQGLDSLASQSFAEELHDVAGFSQPLARIWPLFVSQRLRRETVVSMMKFRTVVEPRLPFLDNDLISVLLNAPPELKLGEDIQTFILQRRRPAFLNVTNANTGAPMGAAKWRQRLATMQMKIFSKLGVPGYQPYERLGLWLRRDLAPMVREILLDERTLERGVFQPEGIRTVVRRHLEQGQNHTYLLMALMIFELGLRRLCDGTNADLAKHREAELVVS